MKNLRFVLVIITLIGFILIGCSDNLQSPVEPTDQGSEVSLAKKGPIVHSVNGSNLFTVNDKNAGGRVTAREYADGTYDGEYEINAANSWDDKTMKWNGKVLSLKVYENIGDYGGKMAVIGGVEKTGPYAGWYEVWFVIDNGKVGQNSSPDQHSYYVGIGYDPFDLTEAEGMWNADPSVLINWLLVEPDERGNVTVK